MLRVKKMTRKLHIGGEHAHPDWEIFNIQKGPNVDHIGDAKDLSRFEDETFDELYASHVVEHFDYNGQLLGVLKEWYRVLKPEGKLYISVPDMDVLCQLFRECKGWGPKASFEIMRVMFGGHIDQYDYHYVGFDYNILAAFLNQAKFQKLKRVKSFAIFEDASRIFVGNIPISISVIALK